jgi:hypothetical protein
MVIGFAPQHVVPEVAPPSYAAAAASWAAGHSHRRIAHCHALAPSMDDAERLD